MNELQVKFYRKPSNLKELKNKLQKYGGSIEKVLITDVLKLNNKEWINFTNNFFQHNPSFENQGGINKLGLTNVIMVINTKTFERIFINSEGYNYARYVGIECGKCFAII